MYYINTEVEKKARRYFEPDQEQWFLIDDIMRHHKNQAHCTTYESTNLSRESFIGKACEDFATDILDNIYPRPKLLNQWNNKDENIELTMVLDSMAETGTTIGSACYRLAEQLHSELTDNGIENDLLPNVIRPQWSGEHVDNENNCYLKYFERDENAIYLQGEYFVGLLKGHKFDKTTSSIADELDNLRRLSPSYRIRIYYTLQMLFYGMSIKFMIESIYENSKEQFFKHYTCRYGVPSKDRQSHYADTVASVIYCERLTKIIKEADAAEKVKKEDSNKDDKANNHDNNKDKPVGSGESLDIDW